MIFLSVPSIYILIIILLSVKEKATFNDSHL